MNKCKPLLLVAAIMTLSAADAYSQNQTERNQTMTNIEITKTDYKTLEREKFDVYVAVSEAIAPYIEGAKAGNTKKIQSAFNDHATMAGTMGGKFSQVNAIATFGVIEIVPSPELRAHITWIDISGPVASAKVEFIDWMGIRYTDYLLLALHEGVWKISGKAYDAHSAGFGSE